MSKFLIFIDAADDAAMYPVESLLGLTVAGDGALIVKFKSSIGKSDGGDIVTLTVTADTELKVFKSLAKSISDIGSFSGENFLVVCDDVNSVFAHPDILSCAITLDT
jgi:hypothetical protein|tara:strand:- start:1201 stop:1521 length:321 start_codon:yes stop_codon:yes gene_type:complete